jgi:hypothetical protein
MLPPAGVARGVLAPVLDAAERATFTVDDAEPAVLRATLTLRDASQAPIVQKTLESALTLTRNMIANQRQALAAASDATVRPGAAAVGNGEVARMTALLDAAAALDVKIEANGNVVTVTATVDGAGALVATQLVPLIEEARNAARSSMSSNNLRQLAIAMHMYHDTAGSLPPAVVYGKSAYGALNPTGNAAGDVPRSWRVELLPLLGQDELYKQYRLDQPWDSEANRRVLAKMPAVFRSPHDDGASTNASYFAVTGPGTIFDDKDGTKFTEITDGTSTTIMLVEAKQATPWTKPEDIAYEPGGKLPALGGWQPGAFWTAMADGASYRIDAQANAEAIPTWLDKAAGNVAPSPAEAAAPAAVAPAPGVNNLNGGLRPPRPIAN